MTSDAAVPAVPYHGGMAGDEQRHDSRTDGGDGVLAKPAELLSLGPVCRELFDQLRQWFDIPERLECDLSEVDSPIAVTELQDPHMIAAFAMRRLQAVHLLSTQGIMTTTDVIVTQIDSVLRALMEAPRSQLLQKVVKVDWDQEWAILDSGMLWRSIPLSAEKARVDQLVAALIRARNAVIDASGSEICYFV